VVVMSFQSTEGEKIDKFNQLDESTHDTLRDLASEFSPEKLSPTLKKIQPLLAELVKKGPLSEPVHLPVPNHDIIAFVDNNNEIKYVNNTSGENIPVIAQWLKNNNL